MAAEQRLVDAEWLKTRFYAICDFYDTELIHIDRIIDEIDNAPEGVLEHGWWMWITEDIYRCTHCNAESHVKEVMEKPVWGFCPECGSLMDGGADNG